MARTYRAAVAAEIADVPDVPLSPATRALATEAATEIARFDQQIGADLLPLSAALHRAEAAASSRIESVIASSEAVGLAELGDLRSESAAALLGSTEPESAGKWRMVQDWIGGSSSSPPDAIFVPPQPDRLPGAIHDLERFLARNDLPVRWFRPRSRTRSSRPSTPSPTATDVPDARWCTACCGPRN